MGEVSLQVSDMMAWGWGEGEEWRKELEMKAADESDLSGRVAFVEHIMHLFILDDELVLVWRKLGIMTAYLINA